MEHPVKEIAGVITSLCKGTPQEQEATLRAHFLSNASFAHPFCRVPSFSKGTIPLLSNIDSLWAILGIYRWYRTLSPEIQLHINSAVFDQRTGFLYVSIQQNFSLWFVPFYQAPVRLVTVLKLEQRTSSDSDQASPSRNNGVSNSREAALAGLGQERAKYYIASQEDLYQVNEFLAFVLPGLGPLLWVLWQFWSAIICVVGSVLFLPLYLVLNRPKQNGRELKKKD